MVSEALALDAISISMRDQDDEKKPNKEASLDWEALRRRSLLPGGFGPSRAEIWPQLLGVSAPPNPPEAEAKVEDRVPDDASKSDVVQAPLPDSRQHRDERQIRLDTNRSFVMYPVGSAAQKEKDVLQEELHQLIVSVFRKRPKLNYFQGYHDIITVLFLTLPPETQFLCAEKLSLHRVRDSMGPTLEPVVGLLRVTKNLLRLADPSYADQLEKTSPLPFHALSNLLTLFSHDIPTLPLIQHVFDYILCRPPIIIVYLAAAIILARKEDIERLELGDDDDDEGASFGMTHSILSAVPDLSDGEEELVIKSDVDQKKVHVKEEQVSQASDDLMPDGSMTAVDGGERTETFDSASEVVEPEEIGVKVEGSQSDIQEHLAGGPPDNVSSIGRASEENFVESGQASQADASERRVKTRSKLSLPSLLTRSDLLYTLYPPTHPSLSLSSIMGPQSVVFTWSESHKALPTDDEVENMITVPSLVVYPPLEDESDEKEEESEEEKRDWKGRPVKDRTKRAKERRRAKLRKRRKFDSKRALERRTMVAGAVLVLGVAMAVYGVKARGGAGGLDMETVKAALGGGIGSNGGSLGRKVVAWMGEVTGKVLGGS